MPESGDLRRYAQIGLAIIAVVASIGAGYTYLNRGGRFTGPHVVAVPGAGPVGIRPAFEIRGYPGDKEVKVYLCVGATSELGDCAELAKGRAGQRLRSKPVPATFPDGSDVAPARYVLRVGPDDKGAYLERGSFEVEAFTIGRRVSARSYRGVDPARLTFGAAKELARGAQCMPPHFLVDGRIVVGSTVLDPERGSSIAFPFQAAEIAWSPARDKLAYITTDHKEVRLAGPDGSDAAACPSGCREARGLLSSLTWSPSGDRLAFIAQNDPAARNGPGPPTVRIINATNGQVSSAGPGLWVSWSPSDNLLAVERANSVIEASTPEGGRRQLTTGKRPSWSPDGSFVGVIRNSAEGGEEAWIVSADGKKSVRASDPGVCAMSFAPANDQIAVVANRDGQRTLFLKEFDGPKAAAS